MASTGHAGTHAPQSMHSSGWMKSCSAASKVASSFLRVDAIHRTHVDARAVLGADAGFRDDVGHVASLLHAAREAMTSGGNVHRGRRQPSQPPRDLSRQLPAVAIHRGHQRGLVRRVTENAEPRHFAARVIHHRRAGAAQRRRRAIHRRRPEPPQHGGAVGDVARRDRAADSPGDASPGSARNRARSAPASPCRRRCASPLRRRRSPTRR